LEQFFFLLLEFAQQHLCPVVVASQRSIVGFAALLQTSDHVPCILQDLAVYASGSAAKLAMRIGAAARLTWLRRLFLCCLSSAE
jgi:hypothetical protein